MPKQQKSQYSPVYRRTGEVLISWSEWLNDERLSQYRILRVLSHKLDRPPSVLAHTALLFLVAVLILNPSDLSGPCTNLVGLVLPAFGSFKHLYSPIRDADDVAMLSSSKKKQLESERKESTRLWLDYWLVYSTFLLVESMLGQEVVLAFVPLWWAMKALAIIRFLASEGEDTKKEQHKPRPLRLRPRSHYGPHVLASSAPSTAQPTGDRPAPSGRGQHVNDGDDEISDSDIGSGSETEGTTAVDTSINPAVARIREELDGHSPLLSVPPARVAGDNERSILTPTSLSDPDGSPFDLSDGSASSASDDLSDSTDSPSESEDESESDAASKAQRKLAEGMASDSESELSTPGSPSSEDGSDSDALSGESDDSDKVLLPPNTPLDILGLREMKTERAPRTDGESTSLDGNHNGIEVDSSDGEEGAVKADLPQLEELKEVSMMVEAQADAEDESLEEASSAETRRDMKQVDVSGHSASTDEMKRQVPVPLPEDRELPPLSPRPSTKREAKTEPLVQLEASNQAAEGKVVKVSLEDLLAMGEAPSPGWKQTDESDEEKEELYKASTAPLRVKSKAVADGEVSGVKEIQVKKDGE